MESETLIPEEIYTKIVEWMHINDGAFSSKSEWRKEFLKYLRESLNLKPHFTPRVNDNFRGQMRVENNVCPCRRHAHCHEGLGCPYSRVPF